LESLLNIKLLELAEAAVDKEDALRLEAHKKQMMLAWVKAQRGGLAMRFEDALDMWLKARSLDAWRRLVAVSRLSKLTQDAKTRIQIAMDSSGTVRQELREVQGRLADVEKLKEVDIKLEIITRERKIRELLDQRQDSLPLMPDSSNDGMMPNPPSGDPTEGTPQRWPVGSGRKLPKGDPQRAASQCARLPPTNHYGRAVADARSTPMPARPHTSMDEHTAADLTEYTRSQYSEWTPTPRRAQTSQSRSPEESQIDNRQSATPRQVPHPPRTARQTPRGQRGQGRRPPGRSVPVRRGGRGDGPGLPGDVASDMWAFVNFGTPMTDYVMNSDLPLPKPLRRLVGRDDQPEVGS